MAATTTATAARLSTMTGPTTVTTLLTMVSTTLTSTTVLPSPNPYVPSTLPKPAGGNENHGPLLDASTAWTVALTCIFVALRFWSRRYLTKIRLWWDDWFILAACLATVAGMSLDFVEVHYGFGRHAYYLTEHQVEQFRAYTYGEWIQTFFTLMCTKVSISFFLMRIPAPDQRTLLRPLEWSVVILVISNIVLTVLWIAQCSPIEKAWNHNAHGFCWSRETMLEIIFAQAIFSAVSDFAFAFYPIILLWNVQMNWQRKLGLRLLMGLGVITGACCIVRTVLNGESIPQLDLTFVGIDNWFWRLFEVQAGIIAACIPTLVPIYKTAVHPIWLRASRSLSSLRTSVLTRSETSGFTSPFSKLSTRSSRYTKPSDEEATGPKEKKSSEEETSDSTKRSSDNIGDWQTPAEKRSAAQRAAAVESNAGHFLAMRKKKPDLELGAVDQTDQMDRRGPGEEQEEKPKEQPMPMPMPREEPRPVQRQLSDEGSLFDGYPMLGEMPQAPQRALREGSTSSGRLQVLIPSSRMSWGLGYGNDDSADLEKGGATEPENPERQDSLDSTDSKEPLKNGSNVAKGLDKGSSEESLDSSSGDSAG